MKRPLYIAPIFNVSPLLHAADFLAQGRAALAQLLVSGLATGLRREAISQASRRVIDAQRLLAPCLAADAPPALRARAVELQAQAAQLCDEAQRAYEELVAPGGAPVRHLLLGVPRGYQGAAPANDRSAA